MEKIWNTLGIGFESRRGKETHNTPNCLEMNNSYIEGNLLTRNMGVMLEKQGKTEGQKRSQKIKTPTAKPKT